jgi:hypothetical protein
MDMQVSDRVPGAVSADGIESAVRQEKDFADADNDD